MKEDMGRPYSTCGEKMHTEFKSENLTGKPVRRKVLMRILRIR
jgi:hypothetical protein